MSNIEKVGLPNNEVSLAFEKYCLVGCSYRQTNGADKCENTNICKHAWGKGATWQREQLEAEIKKLKTEIKTQKFINKESSKMIWEHRDVIKKIQSTREQLIKELREAGEIIKDFCDESFDEHPDCKYQRAEQFLAKLDLLEGDK